MHRPVIGIALGSGAARGWAHLGVLRALKTAGVVPEVVCGSSIGALVGAACVTATQDELETFARALTWREIVRHLDLRLPGGGLIMGRRITTLLRRLWGETTIEDCGKPYIAVATEFGSGREAWLRRGPLVDAVRASIAVPGILSMVRQEDRWLLDGGLVNPVPVSACRALGAELVIAVNLNGDLLTRHTPRAAETPPVVPAPPIAERRALDFGGRLKDGLGSLTQQLLRSSRAGPGYFDVITRAINIMQEQITRARMAGEPPDVLLAPRLRHIGLMEYNRAAEAIEEGERCVQRALPALHELIGG